MWDWLFEGMIKALLDSKASKYLMSRLENSLLKGVSLQLKKILNKYFEMKKIIDKPLPNINKLIQKSPTNKIDIDAIIRPDIVKKIRNELLKNKHIIKKNFDKSTFSNVNEIYRTITKVITEDGQRPQEIWVLVQSSWIKFLRFMPSKVNPQMGKVDTIVKNNFKVYDGTLLKPWGLFYNAIMAIMGPNQYAYNNGRYYNGGAGNILWDYAKSHGSNKPLY